MGYASMLPWADWNGIYGSPDSVWISVGDFRTYVWTDLHGSPQCGVRSIQHLPRSTSAKLLLHSPRIPTLAAASPTSLACCRRALPPSEGGDIFFPHWWPTPPFIGSPCVHHTSGTASGLHKPVPQLHTDASLFLPCLPSKEPVAALTATPLYRGGVAYLFRSMVSQSMIWLFPPSVPITVQDIAHAGGLGREAPLGR